MFHKIPSTLFEKMFTKYSRTTTTLLVGVIAWPYALQIPKCIFPPNTYEDGKREGYKKAKKEFQLSKTYESGIKDGYEKAKNEFRDKCNTSISSLKSVNYAAKTLSIVEGGGDDKFIYMDSTAVMWSLPKWYFDVFDESYVVRLQMKPDNPIAFMLPKKESDVIDATFRKILLTKYTLSELEDIQRKVKSNIYKALDETTRVFSFTGKQ